MLLRHKPIHRQVFFITSATTDVGVATVHRAVEQGAKVFMVDLDEDQLQLIQDEMRMKGYDTAYAVADLTEEEQLQFAADKCQETFGGIDTWVNIPGHLNVSEKRQFEAHYWALVNGCQVATPYMKEKGGVIVNVARAYSDPSFKSDHLDTASTDAVRGFSAAYRKELKEIKAPIQISLVLSTDNESITRDILKCASYPTREAGGDNRFTKSFKSFFLTKEQKGHERSLIASGVGSLAVAGGMTFFLLRKFRIL